jgi:hypothetical protein
MKKNRADEPCWVVIHKYMEMSKGNSLFTSLKQARKSFFFFFFYKIKGQNCRAGPVQGGGRLVPV